MNRLIYRYLQTFVTLGLAAFLAAVLISGRIDWYINARFNGLVIFAVVCLASMAGFSLYNLVSQDEAETGHHRDPGAGVELVILAIPLLLVLLVPASPLSAGALDARGMNLAAPAGSLAASGSTPTQSSPQERSLLDWVRILNQESDLTPYRGEKVHLVGFVFHDKRLEAQQFMLGRFIITCCVADAYPIGMAVQSKQPLDFPQDAWVEVTGTIATTTIDGVQAPMISASSIEPVPAPEQPYLFP